MPVHTATESSQSEFQIRRAVAADAEQILACLHSAFAPYENQYPPEAFVDTVLTATTLAARLNEMLLFVAVVHDRVIGTIGCKIEHGEGHLRGMAVLAEWQGTPVAAELLQAAEQEVQAQRCSRATLDTTAPLQRAIRFYTKHGYTRTGRISDFFGMPLYEYAKSL